MKQIYKKTVVLLLLVSMLSGCVTFAQAAAPTVEPVQPCASAYFGGTDAWLTPSGNGYVLIEFDVVATGYMKELGAKSITLYEKLPGSSTFSIAKIYNRYNTSGFIAENAIDYYFRMTYKEAIAGAHYYAYIAFYAENSSGNESLATTTSTVIAY